MNLDLKKYIEENLIVPERQAFRVKQNPTYEKRLFSFGAASTPMLDACEASLPEFIDQNKDYSDFQTTLFRMIDERELIDADVYNKVHIDRRLFSKIRNDKNYHPSKETVILLGLSLELNEEEIEELLDSASYSLPKNNYYDLIIRYCFINHIYKIQNINEMLEEYNCKLFSY